MNPDESLLLKKPLMEVGHGGGRRLQKGNPSHLALRQWIAEGMQVADTDKPDLLKIEVTPRNRVLHDGADGQQLVVMGHFSDGTVRDVTPLTVFSSSSESVGTVSETGLIEREGRGETAVLARYLDKMDTSYVTFLEEVPGFEWTDPPEFNVIDSLVNAKLKAASNPPVWTLQR